MDPDIDRKWRRKKNDEFEFDYARNGDHLLTPFCSDTCVFRKIQDRNPLLSNKQDSELLAFIRRANLDSFWSRRPSTVAQNGGIVRRNIQELKDRLDITSGPYRSNGPTTSYDSEGVGWVNPLLYFRRLNCVFCFNCCLYYYF